METRQHQNRRETPVLKELFRIPTPFGDFPIFGYGAMVLCGVLVGIYLLRKGAVRRDLNPEAVSDLAIYLVLFGAVGARTWYLIQFRDQVFSGGNWWEAFALWKGGLVLYGAIAGGLLGFAWLQRRQQFGSTRDLLDVIAPALAIGIAFGRIGCFLNGCCWGGTCPPDFVFGVIFPAGSPPAFALGDGNFPSPTLHPTQLYSAAQGIILCALLWMSGGRWRSRPGRSFALFLALYALGRSAIESIRGDHGVLSGELTVSQWASIVAFSLAIYLWKTAPERTSESDTSSENG